MPLSAVAHMVSKVTPLSVSHQGVFPAVTLSFNLAPGVSLGEATHAVAFVVLHFSVLVASDAIELGVADREIVGADTAGPVNVMSSTDNVRHALVAVSVIASVWLPAGVETEALKLCHELLDTFALRSDFPSRLTCTAGQPD